RGATVISTFVLDSGNNWTATVEIDQGTAYTIKEHDAAGYQFKSMRIDGDETGHNPGVFTASSEEDTVEVVLVNEEIPAPGGSTPDGSTPDGSTPDGTRPGGQTTGDSDTDADADGDTDKLSDKDDDADTDDDADKDPDSPDAILGDDDDDADADTDTDADADDDDDNDIRVTPTRTPGGNGPRPNPNPGRTVEPNDNGGFFELDEFGVPLGEWTWDDGEWVFEEFETPLGNLPRTGNRYLSSFAAMFSVLFLLSLFHALAKRIPGSTRGRR
ncbi:MAG: hypothetical protein FWF83_05965, partial [Clostridiales bacterium]|nr:hypothetical protein [Clostridiales bacterium]